MWLPDSVVADVNRVARVHYIGQDDCARWNEHRDPGELRLLTGWCWSARDRRAFRQGFKSMTVAYRDAWYQLVRQADAPSIIQTRLRVVRKENAA